MKISKTINRLTAGIALILFTAIASLTISTSTVLAATNVQEEGAIYAANVTNGDTAFLQSGTTAKAGDTVAFEVYYHDLESPTSGLDALNIRIKANLPTNFATTHNVGVVIKGDNTNEIDASTPVTSSAETQLQFVPGSITWRHDTGTNAAPQWVTQKISDDAVTNPNGALIDQNEFPCNNFSGTIVFEAKLVGKPTPPPQNPVFTCDAFNITADVNRSVKVSTFATTATNGAVFKNAVVNWGDNSSPLVSANIVGQAHQYAKDGTYTITATAHFTVNGEDVTASGANCAKSVTFSSTTPPKVTPPPVTPPTVTPPTTPAAPAAPAAPTALVNTGPGSVAGLFAATTAIGAMAYRWMLSRRLSRQ